MSLRLVHDARAREDLVNLWVTSHERWGLEQADHYLRHLESTLRTLCMHPELGRDRSELRPGYRSHTVGSHVIFYRVAEDALRVVRVLHGRQDPDKNL